MSDMYVACYVPAFVFKLRGFKGMKVTGDLERAEDTLGIMITSIEAHE